MHRRILAPVAAAALAFGLVACTDTGGSGTVTTPPPSIDIGGGSDDGGAQPSDGGGEKSDGGGDSPVAAPDIPAPDPADYPGMDQNTPEGAEQATRYFIALMFWGYQTGETSEFESMHSESCGVCAENVRSIRNNRENDEFWSTVTLTDRSIENQKDIDGHEIAVGYGTTVSEHTEPNPEGGAPINVSTTHYSFGVGLRWDNTKWVVDGMAIEIQGES